MRETILVIGAHPDDCEIGAGGTIAAYVQRGHRAIVVNFRVPHDGEDPAAPPAGHRRLEGENAVRALGGEYVCFSLDREDIQPNSRLIGLIDGILAEHRPSAVFTHWLGDSHPEHIATTRAVLAATRKNQCSVYQYEATVPGGITPHSFRPQKFVDVSDVMDVKLRSLACHETQIATYGDGWIEAIRGRAAHRGFQMGRRYAEAFEVVKEITSIPDLRGQ